MSILQLRLEDRLEGKYDIGNKNETLYNTNLNVGNLMMINQILLSSNYLFIRAYIVRLRKVQAILKIKTLPLLPLPLPVAAEGLFSL